jgi:hypothetical protein
MPLRVTRVFLVTVVLAVGTEIAQGHPLIQRDPDRYDAIADLLGGTAGIAVTTTWLRLRTGSEMA